MKKINTIVAAALSALTMSASAGELHKKVAFVDVGISNQDAARVTAIQNHEYETDEGVQVGAHTVNEMQFDKDGAKESTYFGNYRGLIGHKDVPMDAIAETKWNEHGSFQQLYGVRVGPPLADYGYLDFLTDGNKGTIAYFGGWKAGPVKLETLQIFNFKDDAKSTQYAEFYLRAPVTENVSVLAGIETKGGVRELIENTSDAVEDSFINVGATYNF
jgi:hypothetical protein